MKIVLPAWMRLGVCALPRARIAGARLMAVLLAPLAVLASTGHAQSLGWSTGSITATDDFQNIFGWRIGGVTITQDVDCTDPCHCVFVGSPMLGEDLAIQDCKIVESELFDIQCPPDPNCPDGKTGQKHKIKYECCISVPPWGEYLCDTYITILQTC